MIRGCLAAMMALVLWPAAGLAQEGGRHDDGPDRAFGSRGDSDRGAPERPGEGRGERLLLPEFEGQIAYFGNYTGRTRVPERDGHDPRVPCPYKDHRCDETTVGGSLKVVLSFDGSHVRGFYVSVGGFMGPNGLSVGSLTGRRTAEGCELFETDGTTWLATTCDSREFVGQILSVGGIPKQSDVKFGTVEMFLRDDGMLRRQNFGVDSYDGRVSYLRHVMTDRFDWNAAVRAAIEYDSYSSYPADYYSLHGLDMNSIGDVQILRGRPGRFSEASASYKLPNGQTGTIYVHSSDGFSVDGISWDYRPGHGGVFGGGNEHARGYSPLRTPPPLARPRPLPDSEGWLNRGPEPIATPGRN